MGTFENNLYEEQRAITSARIVSISALEGVVESKLSSVNELFVSTLLSVSNSIGIASVNPPCFVLVY